MIYYKSYLYPAVLGDDRGELPGVLVAGTHPGTGQTRVQNTSPLGYRLPVQSERPADRRVTGTHTHYPNWKGNVDRESRQNLQTIIKETAINEENFKLTAPCEYKIIPYGNNIEKNILIYDWDSVLDSFKENSK